MKVILSIKPIYAEKILTGEKKFELRKTIFKNSEVKKIIIYASSPISRIIGEFEIDGVLNQELKSLWEATKDFSCVDKDFFNSYFHNKKSGYAIKIKNYKRYEKTFDIQEKYGVKAPQSFSYIK